MSDAVERAQVPEGTPDVEEHGGFVESVESLPKEPSMTGPEIESRSMEIIRSLLPQGRFREEELSLVMRVVHASGDPDIASAIRFHPEAIDTAMKVLGSGASLVVDVRMTLAGINREARRKCGCQVFCAIGDAEVAREAMRMGTTRAAAAMRRLAGKLDGGVAVVGNAPTALREILRMAKEGVATPALVIGMPVGFVDAAESKQALMTSGLVWVTVEGTRGGSALAAAATNALLHRAAAGDRR